MRKSNCYLLIISMLFFSVISRAQSLTLGVRGGVSIPNLTAGGGDQNPLNTGYSSRFGADAGIFVEEKVSKMFSLQIAAEYSSQGGKKNGLQAFPTPAQVAPLFPPGYAPTYLYANFNSQAKLDYLLIPVLAKFSWNIKKSPLRVYFDIGPFAGILLAAHQVTTGQSELYLDSHAKDTLSQAGPQSFNNTQNLKPDLHEFNFGIEGNIGLGYRFGKSTLFFEAGGNYGFLNIQKGSANGKNNTGAATGVLGYSYRLGK
jgi:hypothetical protein